MVSSNDNVPQGQPILGKKQRT